MKILNTNEKKTLTTTHKHTLSHTHAQHIHTKSSQSRFCKPIYNNHKQMIAPEMKPHLYKSKNKKTI